MGQPATLAKTFLLLALLSAPIAILSQESAPATVQIHGLAGTVVALNAKTREVTLAPLHGDKTKTLVGILEKGLKVKQADGTIAELKMSDVMIGGAKMALYNVKTVTANGKTTTTNEIYRFDPIVLKPK